MDNPFSWDYLTTVPDTDDVFSPFFTIFLILFGVGFLISIALYNNLGNRFTEHPPTRRALLRCSGIAMIVFGFGLFFCAIELLQINPLTFGMRLWIWLSFLAAIAMGVYFWRYARTDLREQLRAYEARQKKQQYLRPLPAGAGARVAKTRVTNPSGTAPRPKRRRGQSS
ncbi:MAG: hypothetical protein AVDCRST_MAG73-2635 [uncultured Thermomicrobiales bacterium]|uniref:Uncharacterized protein n=1 Tax=uncultured Thermomicrobiales bacterium TaxID=1645740 RepID=A0A6J4UEE5_9BACT|nr:MAG: hypothetical protein AVDCRST_MAG73-2635 [uncultured Thermomicrobiales bacterium]